MFLRLFKKYGVVSRMDRVRNAEVCGRACLQRENGTGLLESIEMVWTRGENG